MRPNPAKMTEQNVAYGFSLVELVAIMLIVGILAAVALPRFVEVSVFQQRGTADQVMAVLRYGQKMAIAQHRTVSVNLSAGATLACEAVLVAGSVNCVILNSVAVTPALPQTVTFNRLGQPVPNAAASLVVGATTLNIEAETGYVH